MANLLAVVNAGNLALLGFDYDKAATTYANARMGEPSMVEAWFNGSQAELYRNNSDKHKQFLDKAAELDPQRVTAFLKDNDDLFPTAPPSRRAMDPMLGAGQAWRAAAAGALDMEFLDLPVRVGIADVEAGWLILAVALVFLGLVVRLPQLVPAHPWPGPVRMPHLQPHHVPHLPQGGALPGLLQGRRRRARQPPAQRSRGEPPQPGPQPRGADGPAAGFPLSRRRPDLPGREVRALRLAPGRLPGLRPALRPPRPGDGISRLRPGARRLALLDPPAPGLRRCTMPRCSGPGASGPPIPSVAAPQEREAVA